MGSKREKSISSIWSLSARFFAVLLEPEASNKAIPYFYDSITTKYLWALFLFAFLSLQWVCVIKASVLYLKRFRGSGFSFRVKVGFSTI